MKKISLVLLAIVLLCCSCTKAQNNLDTNLIFTGENEAEVNGKFWGISIGSNLAVEYSSTYKGAFDLQCSTSLPENEDYNYEKIVDFETYKKICEEQNLKQNFKNPQHNYIIIAQKTTTEATKLYGALVAVESGFTSRNFKEKLVHEQNEPYITIYHNIDFERIIPMTDGPEKSWLCIIPTTVSTNISIHIEDDVHSTEDVANYDTVKR